MSNLDREIDYRSLTTALDFVFEQRFKDLYTSMPGIVEAYNPQTKRVRVRGAIRIAKTNGTFETRKPVVNVPVVFPSGGGYVLHFPIRPGDAVLLLFSMRGLAEFNRTHAEANPTMSSLLSEKDAVAIPGFGSLEVSPATTTGMSIQTEDGQQSIVIEDGSIHINTIGALTINADTITMTAKRIDLEQA